MSRPVRWSPDLQVAANALAGHELASAEVRQRALEIALKAKMGAVLEPHQVGFVGALRNRFPLCDIGPWKMFEDAWAAAWEAAA